MSTQPNRRRWPALVVVALLASGLVTVAGASPPRVASASSDSDTPVSPSAPSSTPSAVDTADGRLVVGLDAPVTPAAVDALAQVAGSGAPEVVDDHTVAVDAPPASERAQTVDALRADPRVAYVEPNYAIGNTFTPNDPVFPSLPTLGNAQPGGIRAQGSWNTTLGSRDVVVGVLDSGIDATHPDLVGNLWTNRTGVGGCGYGTHGFNAFTHSCNANDDNGHGTHVAGIVGAVGNNGIGITGVAPRVSLLPLKMLDGNGNGSILGAIDAIDWAITAKQAGVGVRVLSASWGGAGRSQALADAITRAGNAGILFVTAAGNDTHNVDNTPVYPCAFGLANVVCVAASKRTDDLAAFSDWGVGHVDLAAPGEAIISTVPPGLIAGCGSSRYCAISGTSMATPMVTGAAVLAVASDPAVTVPTLRARLVHAVDPVASLTNLVTSGGRLDVCKAVPGCGATPPQVPTPPRLPHVTVGAGKATLSWSPPSSNGSGAGITGYTVIGPAGSRIVGPGVFSVNVTGLANNTNTRLSVRARNSLGLSATAQTVARPFNGGFEVDRGGVLRRVRFAGGSGPSDPITDGWPAARGQARGVAMLPDGTGGYIVDQFGDLHSFRVGQNFGPAPATGGRTWPGLDRARGVTILPDGTGGYVLDAFGRLWPFGIGGNRKPAATRGSSFGSYDIARGVSLTDSGVGGYVVDMAGGLHPFAIGAAALPGAASRGPSWPGRDVARGVAISRGTGGGWVLDGTGALHPFRTWGPKPSQPTVRPSWPGLDQARGLAL